LLAPTKANWRAYVHEAVSRVDVLTVRNSSTADFLRSCDVQRHVEIVPDVAVLADAPRQVTAAKSSQLRIGYAPGRPVFPQTFLDEMGRMAMLNMPSANPAVVEMSLWADMFPFEEDVYTDRLADSVRALLPLGELELFGFGAMYGDPQVAALVASKVGRARHLRLGDAGGENALERIRALDCLIAFRLHACISALVVGTPFVAIDLYSTKEGKTTKLLEFVRQLGLESRYIAIEALLAHPERLKETVAEAIAAGREVIEVAHERVTTRAHAHFDALADFITTRTTGTSQT